MKKKKINASKQGGRRNGTVAVAVPEFKEQPMELPSDYPIGPFDYQVAEMAWAKGLSSNTILEKFGLEKSPQNITRVRRALEKAVRHGLIELKPPPNEKLKEQLRQGFPNAGEIDVEVDRTATCVKAARIIADEIEAFLCGPRTEMIIANAGGRTVRDSIDCLQRLVPVPPQIQGKKLIFLSLNAAETHDRYDRCANFLSVRMAQIYDALHFAAVRSWDAKTRNEYRDKLKNIDLLISSAGTLSNTDQSLNNQEGAGFLADWIKSKDKELPAVAVGEIAFHLIDQRGQQVPLSNNIRTMIDKELLRAPDWNDLTLLFRKHKVLLVLAENKIDVGYAVLDSALSQRSILDSHLAMVLANRRREQAR